MQNTRPALWRKGDRWLRERPRRAAASVWVRQGTFLSTAVCARPRTPALDLGYIVNLSCLRTTARWIAGVQPKVRCVLETIARTASCFLGASVAEADGARCYTNASLKGTYAAVTTYSANVALALAIRHFDGEGNLTGTFTLNAPVVGSPTGDRKIITGTQVGTYAVNCDGTGTFTHTLTSATGVVTTQTDDFITTMATERYDGGLLATGLGDAQRTPSALVPGGLFVFRSYTRRPD
jgi:hypothetical protein